MTGGGLGRPAERNAIADFLTTAESGQAGLIIEGEAGIGKTNLWLDAVEQARTRGFRVLAAQVGEAETVLAYAAVGDLLGDIETATLDGLPEVQRLAVDRVLLRAAGDGLVTDQRVVAAALSSIVDALSPTTPVLVAIDDVQWLDPSSHAVVAFAARRLRGRVGVLLSERCEPDKGTAWLRIGEPDDFTHIRLGPMSLGGLHSIIMANLGKPLSRPVMVRIAELSGGNPFYALELARAMGGRPLQPEPGLPRTLAELVRLRIGRLDGDVRTVLLAVASVSAPTVDLLARVNDTTAERIVDLLEGVEADGIVGIVGNRVRFSHPLLARGVYTDATPASRRAMHRALAAIEAEPELRARHLALATASSDDTTFKALDAAADAARGRGAPAAAAELLDLAIGLGGDKPWRRIRAAGDHFYAGNTDHAESVLTPMVDQLRPGMLRGIALNLLAAIRIYDNNFVTAMDLLARAVDDTQDVAPILVQTLLNLSFTQGMGAFAEGTPAHGTFDESMTNARRAATVAETTGIPGLASQALAHWAHTQFMYGHGIDEASLTRALELEQVNDDVPMPFSASAVEALILAYTGRIDEARTRMRAVYERCVERGADRNVLVVAEYCALIEMWSGNLTEAAVMADAAIERAQQLGGGTVDVIGLSIRAAVHAHAGHGTEALADVDAALRAAQACGAPRMTEWPLMAKGFMEVSLGRYDDAVVTFAPMVSRLGIIPGTEIMSGWYLPNAAEAMVALSRLDEAEPLIEALERNGAEHDRPWMLAAGARCRALWLAANGDVDAALESVNRAMAEHDRTPMRFERARTRLLLGKLQRRRRLKDAASKTLAEALAEFEEVGAPWWADHVRAELARTNVRPNSAVALTPSEQRVADLAASGMTNRDVAATLFIGIKTVEHNLSRVYNKLGIRSRAELGRRMDQLRDAE
ncbi:LuxR family transcriptional regulator [Mycobacterium sp. AZCC_0083]|uniref:helix-turn-helix transcriptional regulator n=1 Tax=Mycobacterium sp. AZCC_0083 TaxID=2735882 RepID=UPI00160ACB09|nr:LuxR family transcriptional regulator [Mycobacterium sp. AZCC_0083]MBB5161602.1 DNA-binding CsgD family transcriptional regulator [Mycobacterium sp. AZCC_0083]